MKLRQKLAVVLASAMVVTAVPVVTMAASTASVSKVVTVSKDDVPLGSNAPKLTINLKDSFTSSSQFYLVLEDAKWDQWDKDVITEITTKNGVTGTVTPYSKTEATVKFDADLEDDDVIYIPFTNVVVTGNAVVKVDGNETEINDASFAFAKYSDSTKATVTSKSTKTFYTGTKEVGTIVLAESVVGDLAGETVTVELEHSDYKFVSDTVVLNGTKGYSGYGENEAYPITVASDGMSFDIKLPELTGSGKGSFEISGLEVKSQVKSPSTGDLEVYVTGDKVTSTTVKVATVADYGTTLKVDKVDEVKAGKVATVELTYKQVTTDSVPEGTVEFTVDNGYFTKDSLESLGIAKANWIYEDEDDKNDNEIIGFEITFGGTGSYKEFKEKEVKIQTKLGATGDVTVKTSGRFVEDQEVVVATTKETLKVDAEAMTLKVGQSKQVGGKLVLTEAEAGNFERGKVITLTLPEENGISFTELPTVEADGLTVETSWNNDSTTKGAIDIKVTKASKEAGSITIKDFEVKVDRTVPQGYYDLTIEVEKYAGDLTSEDFFVVGTPNSEELAANGLPKGTATFTIGSANYTVNGKVETMDASAYIQDPGYTMIPVRYVASAFGVAPQDILFSNGTATIFAGTRTIQLTAGSDVAVVNGASIKLATKVVIKDNRTYAPVGEIARILGVSANWDGTNKVATFENK